MRCGAGGATWVGALALLGGIGCASASARGNAAPDAGCPPAVPLEEPARFGSVFIDGKRIASDLPIRQTSDYPEAYELVGPEPAELAAIAVERIDIVQYVRGAEAERRHGLCPGTAALLFTTKPAG